MFKELIFKLKTKKKQLQNSIKNNENIKNKHIDEQSNFEITISRENNIYKIEISDYISYNDYIEKMKSSDKFSLLILISNSVLWNNSKQKINKGTYYVISISNRLYNILFTDKKIIIDERTNKKIDEQTQKENIIEERIITFDITKNGYHYSSVKHDKTGDTFYIRYYDKNKLFNLGALYLTEEETYDEVRPVIYNLEHIEGIENIVNIELLKQNILKDLGINFSKRKKSL